MQLSRTDAEIEAVLERADLDIDRTLYPHDQYATGVAIAVRWLLGEAATHPWEFETAPPPRRAISAPRPLRGAKPVTDLMSELERSLKR